MPARAADDIENATNRSPYPTLHLLREASIERAVAAFPEPEAIYETNMRTLRALGPKGWAELQARCLRQPRSGPAETGYPTGRRPRGAPICCGGCHAHPRTPETP